MGHWSALRLHGPPAQCPATLRPREGPCPGPPSEATSQVPTPLDTFVSELVGPCLTNAEAAWGLMQLARFKESV